MKSKIPRCPFPVGSWVSAEKSEKGTPFPVKTVTYHPRHKGSGCPRSEWLINRVWSGYWLRRVPKPKQSRRMPGKEIQSED